ncbi:hypothetical protein [Aurantiacibacter sediminis]|uniref:Uncharacterized protein n=1 Tax=Aurantiacibacter sediminis TaxID=2793064 RepID=A0ABS0N3M9_9SPHN|nr:hypothetical protein [Aurantiacibacter sediminis]
MRHGVGLRRVSVGALALALAACGGGDDGGGRIAITPSPTPTPTSVATAALSYAATFPAMPVETPDIGRLTGETDLTFGSGLPNNDLAYTMIDTDFIDGETTGYDTFLPVDPSAPVPGADRIKIIRGTGNVDLDLVYSAQEGDRFILGTAEIATPFFARGADGLDNDYAVIQNFDYDAGHIQLRGSASDYELVFCDASDGCDTDGYYLFDSRASELDLIAFIFPCDFVPLPVSGNPPNNPEALCNASKELSLENTNQFRFASPVSTTVAVPQALIQFGSAGKEIVGGQAVDAAGNIYVLGQSDGSLTGGPPADNRIFVAQIRTDGSRGWTYETELPDGALPFDAVADSEYLYVAGRTFGALPGFTSGGAWDGIILKLRLSDGALIATNQFGNRGLDGYGNIIFDNAGNLFVSGQGSPASAMGTDPQHLVAKHRSSDLANIWRVLIEPPATGVLVSEAWGGLDFRSAAGGAAGEGTLTSAGWFFGNGSGGAGAWVERYTGLTAAMPSRTRGTVLTSAGTEPDWVLDNVTDAAGNVYVAGFTAGNLEGGHRGNGDAFIAKYDRDLNLLAVNQIGSAQADAFRKLSIAHDGTLVAIGHSYGDLAGTNADGNRQTGDVIVYRFDADLNVLASRQFGSPHEERGYLSILGNTVVVAGMTEAALGGPSAGSFDAFVVRLRLNDLAFID